VRPRSPARPPPATRSTVPRARSLACIGNAWDHGRTQSTNRARADERPHACGRHAGNARRELATRSPPCTVRSAGARRSTCRAGLVPLRLPRVGYLWGRGGTRNSAPVSTTGWSKHRRRHTMTTHREAHRARRRRRRVSRTSSRAYQGVRHGNARDRRRAPCTARAMVRAASLPHHLAKILREQQILKLRQKATLDFATCEPRLKTLKQAATRAQQG
jgi:hypothetical protein